MKRKQKYETPLRVICALLFATFSFLYIYMFQGELLALLQDNLSDGRTESNAFVAALIITLLLLLLQWGVNRMSKLHGRWEAVSYFPSCMLLALLTDVNEHTMLYSPSRWAWGVLLCTILYIVIVWLNRMTGGVRKWGFFCVLWPNLATLSLLFVLTGQMGNNASASHMELSAWSYIHEGKYGKALEIGRRSEDCNAELTALRNLAMAKTGELGNKLFCYPQPYGANGLLYNKYKKQTEAYGAKEFYRHLGSEAYGGESGRAFAERMCMKSDSAMWRDMYLAALLLDKDLNGFVKAVEGVVQTDEVLPVHYQEALLLYNDLHLGAPVVFTPDSDVVERYANYCTLREEHGDDAIVAKNLCRRKFGNTFWCYYDY